MLPPTSTFDLELGPEASVRDADAEGGWLMLDHDRVLDLETRATTYLERARFMPVGIDRGHAYYYGLADLAQPQGLWRHALPKGGFEAVDPSLFRRPLGVEDGHVVFGAYGAPPPREPTPEEPQWGARDQGWSPRGTGVPDVWAPRDLVQGETAFLMVIEFDARDARVEVASRDGAVVFRDELRLGPHGGGHYGETTWRVPPTLPPGRYVVTATATTGQARVQAEVVVHEAPHLYPSPPEARRGRLDLEAVGFDASPVTATFLQGDLRWEARWSVGRGEPRTHDNQAEVVLVPGAQDPRRVLRAGGGSESVTLSPPIVVQEGEPVLAWFNGTLRGEPRSLAFRWSAPPRETGPYVHVPDSVVVGEAVEVVLHGFRGNVRVGLEGDVASHEAVGGFAQAVLPTSRVGNVTLTLEGTLEDGSDVTYTRSVHVMPTPIPVAHGEDGPPRSLPAPGALALLVLAGLAALGLRRR